jgi:endo-1,3(4)-beta-glucanase
MAPPRGYGSIAGNKDYDEEETRALIATQDVPSTEKTFKKKKWGLIGAGLALILLCYALSKHHSAGSSSTFGGYSDDKDDSITNDTSFQLPPMATSANGLLSPSEVGLISTGRSESAAPSKVWGTLAHKQKGLPLPTNAFYLNIVSHKASVQPDEATNVYTVPYRIDTASPAKVMPAGVRVHFPTIQASVTNIQMVDDFKNMLALGASSTSLQNPHYIVSPQHPLSPLGVSLQWSDNRTDSSMSSTIPKTMETHLVRGMPYVTMKYNGGVLPRLYSYNGPASSTAMKVDGTTASDFQCGVGTEIGSTVTIQKELQFHASNSDFTWIVFFNKPVQATCTMSSEDVYTRDWQLDVTSYEGDDDKDPLVVRLALLDQCTTGTSNIVQHCAAKDWDNKDTYEALLRQHASAVPTSPKIVFAWSSDHEPEGQAQNNSKLMTIDWAVESTDKEENEDVPLLAFALPHHQASLGHSINVTNQCIDTFHGNTCLVIGNRWKLFEDTGSPMSFTAPRPPEASSIDELAQALSNDIQYKLSDNMNRGAADTYFSGKLLARLGRVIVIAEELRTLAAGRAEYTDTDEDSLQASIKAAKTATLPSDKDMEFALDQLRKGVEIWLTKPEATYLYDSSWGGLINCGCRYTTKDQYGVCNNTFPDCPAVADVNQDFGNAWYADHHYHYGYHVYAAAVVSKFDPAWGTKYFDKVMMYIRDFANPFHDDVFVQFRQKDWYLGSSWASGIMSAETSPHGRDQESSSEAIAAYEAVALYGSVMSEIFGKTQDSRLPLALTVREAGQVLVATEIHATNRYWHIWESLTHNNSYPKAYKEPVVGMMHETMASFETWFSQHPVVSYGIQLMPLTPVAEQRDDPEWASIVYPLYKDDCEESRDFCVDNGWSILQAGLLATTGDRQEALKQALAVPSKVYESQGGLGNSLSNLIWYIATRKPYTPQS